MPGLKDDRFTPSGIAVAVNDPASDKGTDALERHFGSDYASYPSAEPDGRGDSEDGVDPGAVDGPVVIDVMGSDGALQSLRIKPRIFLGLMKRLDHPVVAHYKRRLGKHVYFAHCGDFIVETRSRQALDLTGIGEASDDFTRG